MKKALFARGILGSLSLVGVIGAIGCSGEVMDEAAAGNGEIGVSEQALDRLGSILDLASATDHQGNDITNPVGREYAAHCKITKNGVEHILLVGGFSGTPTALGDAYLYNPVNNTWQQMESLPAGQERGRAEMVKIAADKCLLTGGVTQKNGTTLRTTAYVFQVDASDGSWTSAGTMNQGRFNHKAFPCGDGSKAIVISGQQGSLGTLVPSSADVEIWNGTSTWTAQASKLQAPIHSFAAAARSNTEFAVAGGYLANGSPESAVQALVANEACTSITATDEDDVDDLRLATNTAQISGRWGSVAYFKAGTNELYVTAGRDAAGNLPTDVQRFDMTFGATPAAAFNSQVTSLLEVGVRFPKLVASGAGDFILLGGENNSDVDPYDAAPISTTSHLVFSSGVPAKFAGGVPAVEALNSARIGMVAEHLTFVASSVTQNQWFVATGLNAQTNVVLSTGEFGDYTAP